MIVLRFTTKVLFIKCGAGVVACLSSSCEAAFARGLLQATQLLAQMACAPPQPLLPLLLVLTTAAPQPADRRAETARAQRWLCHCHQRCQAHGTALRLMQVGHLCRSSAGHHLRLPQPLSALLTLCGQRQRMPTRCAAASCFRRPKLSGFVLLCGGMWHNCSRSCIGRCCMLDPQHLLHDWGRWSQSGATPDH